MLVAADYPLLDILLTMLVFFLLVSWFWLLIVLLVLPFIGVFAYLIANSGGMARRAEERAIGRYEPPPTYLDADLPPRA